MCLPAVCGREIKGFGSPTVDHVVEHQSALGNFCFAQTLPLKYQLGRDGLILYR